MANTGKTRHAKARDKRNSLVGKWIPVLVTGFLTLLLSKIQDHLAESVLKQPWQALLFVLPSAFLAFLVWRMLRRAGHFAMTSRTWMFLFLYIAVFSGAAVTSLLNWSRSLTALGETAPRNWLTPVSWGDWRYRLVRKAPAQPPKLAIVTTPDSRRISREQARFEMATLIGIAAAAGAKGIAFDFYLKEDSRADSLLCSSIKSAGIPVILGHSFDLTHQEIVPGVLPPALGRCLPPGLGVGHLAGFRDADLTVRFVPMFFGRDQARPALSLLVARQLADMTPGRPAVETPPDGLLRFVEPTKQPTTLTYADLTDPRKAAEHQPLLRDRFVLVGEDSTSETLPTPFGTKLGVAVHADAVHSLQSRSYILKTPWWASGPVIFLVCWLLTVRTAGGERARTLVAIGGGLSAALIAFAGGMMAVARIWFDVVYGLAAIWLLIPLLLALPRKALL